jgi:hypothetical protein
MDNSLVAKVETVIRFTLTNKAIGILIEKALEEDTTFILENLGIYKCCLARHISDVRVTDELELEIIEVDS